MYGLYVKGTKVMGVSYKPSVGDVIKDDHKNKWYKVLSLEGRKAESQISIDPRK